MSPFSDDDLILYYYGEHPEADRLRQALAESDGLRSRLEALQRVLDAIDEPSVPQPHAAYGARTWHQIASSIEAQDRSRVGAWLRPGPRWAWAAAVLALVVGAFLAGRMVPSDPGDPVAGLSADGRDRILMMTVASHLEKSEILLLELVNAGANGEVDLGRERRLAAELGQESRLYRQAAREAGKADVAALLEQLETVLVELAHGPEQVPSAELGSLRLRLDEGDVLFKVRVVGSRLRQQVRTTETSDQGDSSTRDL